MKWMSCLKLRFESQVQTENENPGNEKLNSRFKPEKKIVQNLEKAISWFTLKSPLTRLNMILWSL